MFHQPLDPYCQGRPSSPRSVSKYDSLVYALTESGQVRRGNWKELLAQAES